MTGAPKLRAMEIILAGGRATDRFGPAPVLAAALVGLAAVLVTCR